MWVKDAARGRTNIHDFPALLINCWGLGSKRLRIQSPIEDAAYYCLTLTADDEGTIWSEVLTEFAGYSSGTPRFELRRPRYIDPNLMRITFEQINEPAFMVNDLNDALAFTLVGGHAIINAEVAEAFFTLWQRRNTLRSVRSPASLQPQ